MIRCWDSGSPGGMVIARRRWRYRRIFATLNESIIYHDWVLAIRHDRYEDVRPPPAPREEGKQ